MGSDSSRYWHTRKLMRRSWGQERLCERIGGIGDDIDDNDGDDDGGDDDVGADIDEDDEDDDDDVDDVDDVDDDDVDC